MSASPIKTLRNLSSRERQESADLDKYIADNYADVQMATFKSRDAVMVYEAIAGCDPMVLEICLTAAVQGSETLLGYYLAPIIRDYAMRMVGRGLKAASEYSEYQEGERCEDCGDSLPACRCMPDDPRFVSWPQ